MIHISASLIKDYLSCPAKAYYRTNNPDQATPTKEMAAGTVVHTALEHCWNNYDRALEYADAEIHRQNIRWGTDIIYNSISNWFDLFPFTFKAEDEVEKYFKIPYSDDIVLTGKIDRIHEGKVFDWKTGAWPPDNLNRDVQFIMYYLAYKKLYGDYPESLLYVSLPHKKIYEFEPVENIIRNFEEELLPAVIKGIRGHKPHYGLYGWKLCEKCSYNNLCYTELGLE